MLTTDRPLMRYPGGKAMLAPWIVAHMPPHRAYCEPFGGAASVLLAKPRVRTEVYNDLDGRMANLFRVLRDAPDALADALCLTLYSRREYELSTSPAEDAVEDARRLLVRAQMGIGFNSLRTGAALKRSGFRTGARHDKPLAAEWAEMPGIVRRVAQRFRGVVVEQMDAVDLIRRVEADTRGDVLHYVDPPYHQGTRGENRYVHDLDDAGQERLLACLREACSRATTAPSTARRCPAGTS